MYIKPSTIKIICAALWIGAIYLAFSLHHNEDKYSKDLRRFLDIVALVMAITAFIVGHNFGLFPDD